MQWVPPGAILHLVQAAVSAQLPLESHVVWGQVCGHSPQGMSAPIMQWVPPEAILHFVQAAVSAQLPLESHVVWGQVCGHWPASAGVASKSAGPEAQTGLTISGGALVEAGECSRAETSITAARIIRICRVYFVRIRICFSVFLAEVPLLTASEAGF